MSEEEKEAILELKHFSNITPYWKQEEYTNFQIDNYIKIVLNLIEKQQKEKEKNKKLKEFLQKKNKYTHELEKDLFEGCSNYVIKKDKIREKIKELVNKYVIKFDEKYLRTCGYSEDEIINLYIDYDKDEILNLKDVCDYMEIMTNKINELIDLIYDIDNNK